MKTILLFLALALPAITSAQWEPSSGPFEETIYCFSKVGSTLYAGGDSGLYASTDEGETWDIILEKKVNCMYAADSVIVIGTNNSICYSHDEGLSWNIANGLPQFDAYTAMTIGKNTIYAASETGVIYYSNDLGINWTWIPNFIFGVKVFSLGFKYNYLIVGTDNGVKFYDTTTYTWNTLNPVTSNLTVFNVSVDSNKVYVATEYGAFVTENFGMTWNKLYPKTGNISVLAIDALNKEIIISTQSGVYYSIDNGLNWELKNDGNENQLVNIFFNYNAKILSGNYSGGISKCSKPEFKWQLVEPGKKTTYILKLAGNDTNIVALSFSGILSLSKNNNLNWKKSVVIPKNYYMEDILWTGKKFYGSGHEIYSSTDQGTTWEEIKTGLPNLGIDYISFQKNTLYCAYSYGIVISYNEENNNISNLTYDFPQGINIKDIFKDVNYLFVGGSNGSIYRLNTLMSSWEKFPINSIQDNIFSLIRIKNYLFAGTQNNGVFRSSDDGETWEQVSNGFNINGVPAYNVWSLVTKDTFLFAGTTDGGVFATSNYGDSWIPFNEGLGLLPDVRALTISDHYLFAGTHSMSVFRRSLNDFTSTIPFYESVKSNILYQNEPNPFNNETKIPFHLKSSALVSIAVTNILGEKLETYSIQYSEPGHYTFQFDGSHFQEGVYFYSLSIDGETHTKKMIVQH